MTPTLKCPVCKNKTVSLTHFEKRFVDRGQGVKRYQTGTLSCSGCDYEEVLGNAF